MRDFKIENNTRAIQQGYNDCGDDYMEEWITTFEASLISNYELDYIRKLVRAEKIEGRKWGQSWQVNRASLMKFLARREKQGMKRGRKPIPKNNN